MVYCFQKERSVHDENVSENIICTGVFLYLGFMRIMQAIRTYFFFFAVVGSNTVCRDRHNIFRERLHPQRVFGLRNSVSFFTVRYSDDCGFDYCNSLRNPLLDETNNLWINHSSCTGVNNPVQLFFLNKKKMRVHIAMPYNCILLVLGNKKGPNY